MCRKKAILELGSKLLVRQAIEDMCYVDMAGLNLKVDVPFFLPNLRREILGTGGKVQVNMAHQPNASGQSHYKIDIVTIIFIVVIIIIIIIIITKTITITIIITGLPTTTL